MISRVQDHALGAAQSQHRVAHESRVSTLPLFDAETGGEFAVHDGS